MHRPQARQAQSQHAPCNVGDAIGALEQRRALLLKSQLWQCQRRLALHRSAAAADRELSTETYAVLREIEGELSHDADIDADRGAAKGAGAGAGDDTGTLRRRWSSAAARLRRRAVACERQAAINAHDLLHVDVDRDARKRDDGAEMLLDVLHLDQGLGHVSVLR